MSGRALQELARRTTISLRQREVPQAPLHLTRETLRARLAQARSLDQHVARLGYAGLSSFTHLEPEVAKLDMSLIRGVGVDPRRQHIVEAMTRLSAASSGW